MLLTIEEITLEKQYILMEDRYKTLWTDEMIEGKVEDTITTNEQLFKISNISLEKEMEWNLPKGYQFVDENGNVINATKIVLEKKKKEYPKTYEECCEIIKVGKEHTLEGTTIRINYKIALLESFQKLLICRDAYWKIAGEEMGLGKPWEPDFSSHEEKFSISVFDRRVVCIVNQYDNIILTFPTREMRDAFYDNFAPDIQFCNEFL